MRKMILKFAVSPSSLTAMAPTKCLQQTIEQLDENASRLRRLRETLP